VNLILITNNGVARASEGQFRIKKPQEPESIGETQVPHVRHRRLELAFEMVHKLRAVPSWYMFWVTAAASSHIVGQWGRQNASHKFRRLQQLAQSFEEDMLHGLRT
jgi:hypothetical protein